MLAQFQENSTEQCQFSRGFSIGVKKGPLTLAQEAEFEPLILDGFL